MSPPKTKEACLGFRGRMCYIIFYMVVQMLPLIGETTQRGGALWVVKYLAPAGECESLVLILWQFVHSAALLNDMSHTFRTPAGSQPGQRGGVNIRMLDHRVSCM